MTKRTELYKCEICGNIVEIHHHGASALVCCNEKMQVYTKFLEPDMKPEAIFEIDSTIVNARAYCNLHGNWKNN